MLVILILGPLLRGRIRVSTSRRCMYRTNGIRLLTFPLSKRVFILGPSHHLYIQGCALSACKEYETPIGNLPLDLDSKCSAVSKD